jgi:NADPH:quinone reductase-like Zn-dependent oxidoreductase
MGSTGELPATMRAAVIHEHGGPDKLAVHQDWPVPRPGPGEIVVKVRFCGLNYLDIFVREGMPGEPVALPTISGGDVAGDVAAVGDGVDERLAGAAVVLNPSWSCGECEYCRDGDTTICLGGNMLGEGADGGMAEYVKAPAANAIPLPEGVSYEHAACVPVAWGTAHRMLIDRAKLRVGEDLLVLAAAGGVGLGCVQIGRMAGARVFAAASSDDKLRRLKELGADEVVNYTKDPDWDRTLRAMTNKRGMDVVVDNNGAATWEKSIRVLGKRGRLVSTGATSGPIGPTDIRYLFRREHNILGSNGWRQKDILAVLRGIQQEKLTPVIHKIYPLEEARAAEEALANREVFGKVLIQP